MAGRRERVETEESLPKRSPPDATSSVSGPSNWERGACPCSGNRQAHWPEQPCVSRY